MRAQALRARPRRKRLPSDKGERNEAAANVLDRQFVAMAPNQKWIADFTYLWTAEGWLYVAAGTPAAQMHGVCACRVGIRYDRPEEAPCHVRPQQSPDPGAQRT